MADNWPASLPTDMNASDYAEGMADGRLMSQTDTGPAKVRLRSSAMARPLKGSMIMTGAQVATLRTFVDTTLLGGTLPFNFTDPIDGSTVLARFAESLPTWSSLGGDNWTVNLDLEVLP